MNLKMNITRIISTFIMSSMLLVFYLHTTSELRENVFISFLIGLIFGMGLLAYIFSTAIEEYNDKYTNPKNLNFKYIKEWKDSGFIK